MELSKILVARSADLGYIKVVGRGSFQNSGCIKAFYQQLLKEGVGRFVVDLGACTYLDSTFLGILLGLGLKLREAGSGVLRILNASPRNLELLKNLGLDRLISIEGGDGTTIGGSDFGGPDIPGMPVKTGPLGNGSGTGALQLNGVKEVDLKEMKAPALTKAEAGPTILEAHENLIGFDPRNVPKFKDVVEFLREDLGPQTGKN